MLVKTGIAFNIHGFIVMPYLDLLIIVIMGVVFTALCVRRFNGADFSVVKAVMGHHR
jgi:ABC-2 type transport system permease protein